MNQLFIRLRYLNKYPIVIGIFLTLLVSCKKEIPEPLYTKGVITGRVNINDFEYDNEEHKYSDIVVKAYGPYGEKSTSVSYENYSATFKFDGLGNGTYRVSVSKKGYGTIEAYTLKIFENDTVYAGYFDLYKQNPNASVPLSPLQDKTDSQDKSIISFTIGEHNSPLIMFLSSRPDVAYNKYQSIHVNSTSENTKFLIYVNRMPFVSGTRVYCILYPYAGEYYGYFNAKYGVKIFSSIIPSKHSNVFSFIMP